MPTIQISHSDLIKLIGKQIPMNELKELILLIKGEVDDVENDIMTVEFESDRIDMLSVEGIARTLKGFLGIETGIPQYWIDRWDLTIRVDPSVNSVRPHIVGAVVTDIELEDNTIAQLMQLQEKLHNTWGRRRRKASIGIYDLKTIQGPITYIAKDPKEIKFVPLEESKEMTATEILEEHPKGREFAHLLEKFDKYPLLIDSKGTVLSMPPIINSEDTKVTEKTRNLFIDVTGIDEKTINYALNVISANLAERGAKIFKILIEYPNREVETPNFEPKKMKLKTDFVNQILGMNLSSEEIIELLRKARLDGHLLKDNIIETLIPPYRPDFLHPVDIVEDIAIAYGYNKIEPELPNISTIGKELESETFASLIRDIMVGAGYQEIRNYIMTNKTVLFDKFMRKERPVIEVENPMSILYSVLRDMITPTMLEFLSYNIHVPYPQRVFEVGEVVIPSKKAETLSVQELHAAAAISDVSVSFEDIHSTLHYLLKQIKINYYLVEKTYSYLIKGRSAEILINDTPVGFIGEIHPQVLVNYGLENPVAVFEVNLSKLLELS